MQRASAPSAPLASSYYYEKLGRLQHGLRDSEKKRLDLERKLYEYNQSDICRVKLKYVRLKKYLKEICESEKKARTRNQEYLKRFDQVQAHVGHFTTSSEKLQELKIEYETQIKKMQLLSKDGLGKKGELKDEDREKVVMLAEINSGTAVSRGLYQPATIFMGRQMSAVSSIGDLSTEQKSPQPTKNFSIPDPHLHRQTARSSNVTDSYVVQTHSDTQCLNKSDRIDEKSSLQMGEKTPVTASSLSEEEQTHCSEIGSNARQGKSNLSEGKKSAELHSPSRERLSPENRTTDLKCDSSSRSEGSEGEILTREHIEVEEERARPPVCPLSGSEYCASENECSQEKHPAWEASSEHLPCGDPESQEPFRKMREEQEEESLSSSSDLTVSVSEDDLILRSPEPQPHPDDTMEEEDGIEALNLIHSKQERDAPSTEKQNCILQTVSSADSEKESSTNSPTREFCNHSDILRGDLDACGAAVLHQLPKLSPGGGSDEEQVRFEQALGSGLWRTRSGQHVATLKGHDNSIQEEVVAKLSEVFPVKNVDQRRRATALLNKGLAEERGDRSAVHSSESSCSSPSTLDDKSGIKHGKPALWLSSVPTRAQEVSSGGDESAEESMAARMPVTGKVTETKAYQMLKQFTLRDSAHQAEEGFQKAEASASQLSGLNVGSGTFKTKTAHKIASEAGFSSSEGSPLSRQENKKKLPTTLKSKAFWGESDDSNSEIEAALRPRNHNTSTDDFDDFYDL
ncbi:centrosomal protein kizuna isoform X3 [Hippopotamus amphibius kiboko]|uniref:centrosomal protein kizuna isoform X3 n=1 Tax=Hippopotamus amphibius kiboko TaxID=575201 RepID=UPI002595DFA9|nr:centrosomal protein kizuna isoform X3 [Hippopotamus amphibius kiboko]